jgi:hypothetical protein
VTELDLAPGPDDAQDDVQDDAHDPAPAATAPDLAPATTALPPDPDAYDAVRNVHARARGLPAPYIAGGTDPDPEPARREERYYGRLLLGMVLAIVLSGFVIGILVAFATAGT